MADKRRKNRTWVDDATAWERVAETVKPLKPGARRALETPVPVRPEPVRLAAPRKAPVGAEVPRPQAPEPTATADPKMLRRLRRGEYVIDATLDLHHQTLDQAHRSLRRFIDVAYQTGRRTILVITGRGLGPNGATGKIRAAVPRWLDEPGFRERILGVTPAQPRDGGAGALYVLIRRKR